MNRILWFFLFAACLLVFGCDPADGEDTPMTGQATFDLTSTGSSGAVYNLRDAVFEISGLVNTTLSSETDPSATVLSVDLPTGSYTVELLEDWRMEVTTAAGTFPIEADLISENPVDFDVEQGEVTSVVYVFWIDGEQVPFGDGTVEISIDVQESGSAGGELTSPEVSWNEGASEPLVFSWNAVDLRNTSEYEYYVYPQVGFTENSGPWGSAESTADEFEYSYEMALSRVRPAEDGIGAWYWGCNNPDLSCKPSNPDGHLALIAYSTITEKAVVVSESGQVDTSAF